MVRAKRFSPLCHVLTTIPAGGEGGIQGCVGMGGDGFRSGALPHLTAHALAVSCLASPVYTSCAVSVSQGPKGSGSESPGPSLLCIYVCMCVCRGHGYGDMHYECGCDHSGLTPGGHGAMLEGMCRKIGGPVGHDFCICVLWIYYRDTLRILWCHKMDVGTRLRCHRSLGIPTSRVPSTYGWCPMCMFST